MEKRKVKYNNIPTSLTREQFEEFVEPILFIGSRGPEPKIELFKTFNYILKVLYTGMQWKELPIDKNEEGKPEIHYTSVFKKFAMWSDAGAFEEIFMNSLNMLKQENKLDTSIINGDGVNTVAKKGGIKLVTPAIKNRRGKKI